MCKNDHREFSLNGRNAIDGQCSAIVQLSEAGRNGMLFVMIGAGHEDLLAGLALGAAPG